MCEGNPSFFVPFHILYAKVLPYECTYVVCSFENCGLCAYDFHF